MTARNTTIRDRHRRAIAKDQPPCHLCGEPIDYTAGHLDPLSFHVDHIIPMSKGGTDTIENKAASHRACNRMKSDRIEGEDPRRRFVTTLTW